MSDNNIWFEYTKNIKRIKNYKKKIITSSNLTRHPWQASERLRPGLSEELTKSPTSSSFQALPSGMTKEIASFSASSLTRAARLEIGDLINAHKIPSRATSRLARDKELSTYSTLDLHGLTQDQAFDALKRLIKNAYNHNKKELLIITGKGQPDKPGVIRLEVPRWLQYTELKEYVLSYSIAKDKLGGEGAISVILKRNKGDLKYD